MTKKDYIKFADMIAERKIINKQAEKHSGKDDIMLTYGYGYDLALIQIQDDMINIFKQDNPLFDEDRFNQYIEQKVLQLSR